MFFLRVKAIYVDSKIVTVCFGLLWLAIFGSLFSIPFDTTATHIGPTKRCIIITVNYHSVIPLILQSAFDTFIFIAISFRIASYSMVGDTFVARIKSLFRGRGLPHLSRSIIQGGQLYYLFVNSDFIVDDHLCSPF